MKHELMNVNRLKTFLYGGLIGAAFGVVIGGLTGFSVEAAVTGLVGGWLLGELISLGINPNDA